MWNHHPVGLVQLKLPVHNRHQASNKRNKIHKRNRIVPFICLLCLLHCTHFWSECGPSNKTGEQIDRKHVKDQNELNGSHCNQCNHSLFINRVPCSVVHTTTLCSLNEWAFAGAQSVGAVYQLSHGNFAWLRQQRMMMETTTTSTLREGREKLTTVLYCIHSFATHGTPFTVLSMFNSCTGAHETNYYYVTTCEWCMADGIHMYALWIHTVV